MRITVILQLLLWCCLPSLAYADIFPSNPNDQSIFYLGEIFGHMGSVLLPQDGNQLFPAMFRIFNIIVLTLGTMLLTYTTVVAAVHTAQEGEVMGKKWSSVWLPLRSALGIAILVPVSNGYSLVQIAMMWMIVQGVGAANQIWNVVLTNYASGYSMSVPAPIINLDDAAKNLFRSAVCMEYFNSDPTRLPSLGIGGATLNTVVSPYIRNNTLYIGVESATSSPGSDLCGSLLVKGATQQAAILAGFDSYSDYAREAVTLPASEWVGANQHVVSIGKGIIADGYTTARQSSIVSATSSANASSSVSEQVAESAKEDGWMYAGAFYFTLVNKTKKSDDSDVIEQMSKFPDLTVPALRNAAESLAANYITATEPADNTDHSMNTGGYQGAGSANGDVLSVTIGALVRSCTDYFTSYMTEGAKIQAYSDQAGGSTPDPLLSLGNLGMKMLRILETAWITTVFTIFGIMMLSSAMAGCLQVGHSFLGVFQFILPLVVAIMGLLVPAAVMLGIYMPLIPYMLYLSGVIAWLILCIEAIAAAPLVAIGLAAPGEENLGKAQHAIMICLNLFLRPSLMVIGFVAASRLLIAVFSMFNYSFAATLYTQIGSTGIFGSVALLVIFTGIVVTLTNECFALIHILPDRTLRWIGGSPESLAGSVAEKVTSEAKTHAEKGGALAHEGTKQATTLVSAAADAYSKKGSPNNTSVGGTTGDSAGGTPAPGGSKGAKAPPKLPKN